MRYLFLLFPFLLLTIASIGCKTSYTSPLDYPKDQLVFGSGGGFAGTVNTYYLLGDGALYHEGPGDTTMQKINTITKSEAKALLAEAEALEIGTRSLDAPGNMYAFVEWKNPDGQNRLVWDMAGEKPDEGLKAFHKKLMQLTTAVR